MSRTRIYCRLLLTRKAVGVLTTKMSDMENPRYPCCIAPVDTTFMRTKPLIGGATLTEEQVLDIANAKLLENVKRLNVW